MTTGGKLHAGRAGDAWTAAGNVTASAGWGSTAAVTLQAGSNDCRGQIIVTVGGTGMAAGPTLACTFNTPVVAYDVTPVVVAMRGDAIANAVGETHVTAQSTTGFTITFDGTPTGTEVYKFNYLVVG